MESSGESPALTEPMPTSESDASGFQVADTFAEAFPMTAARLIVTADTPAWAAVAGQTTTGYATSVISCATPRPGSSAR